jgi:hypothetical protein
MRAHKIHQWREFMSHRIDPLRKPPLAMVQCNIPAEAVAGDNIAISQYELQKAWSAKASACQPPLAHNA